MRLLVGLGNPGAQYAGTRHNLGFDLVDAVAKKLGVTGWKQAKGGELAQEKGILLFKPAQFMNRSGLPVRQILEYYNLESSDVCVAADDVYVAPGSARIRHTGGDGGHNGWKSVLEHMPSSEFWRIRIGAGIYEQHPEKRAHQPSLEDYVLQPLPPHDRKAADNLIDRLVPDLVQWLEHGTLAEATVHI